MLRISNIVFTFEKPNGNNMKFEKIKLKPIPVYLPIEKHTALMKLSADKRTPVTRLIEAEIDRLLKREAV